MLVFVKSLATALLFGLIGLMIGPIAAFVLMSAPAEACGMWWIIPVGTGALVGGGIGVAVGFVLGALV